MTAVQTHDRDYFHDEHTLPIEATGATRAPHGAPTAADLLLRVVGGALAVLDSPAVLAKARAERVRHIDAQIAELLRERDRLAP